MKKVLLFFWAIMIICGLSACSDLSKTGKIESAKFEDIFINELPEEVDDASICKDLYIEQSNSILGDPNFVKSFKLCFKEDVLLQNHLQNINTGLADELQIGGKTYYVFQGNKELLQEYTNSEILDGYYFIFEIICVDRDALELEYVYAYVWDYWKNEFLISKLERIMDH